MVSELQIAKPFQKKGRADAWGKVMVTNIINPQVQTDRMDAQNMV